MFLANYKKSMVLVTETGILRLTSSKEFNWSSFQWPESISNNYQTSMMNNFSSSLVKCPVFPTKIVCVGRNYVAHAKELGNIIPDEPLLFLKPNSALLGPQGKIILPSLSNKVDYETELVAVIGKKTQGTIPEKNAMKYILGYTIGLDITARDLQRKDKSWFRGKGFDTFAPVGPWIASSKTINLDDCRLTLHINGQIKQQGNIRDMVFKIPYLIHYISKIVTLNPGDIIFTGTPEGVGEIHAGDSLKAEIENIGILNVSVN